MKNKIKSFIGYILIISLFIFSLKKCSDFSHKKTNLKHLNSDLNAMKKEQKEMLYYANEKMQNISFEKKLNENKIDSLNLLVNNLSENKIIYKINKIFKTNNIQNIENIKQLDYLETSPIKDSLFNKIVYIEKIDTVFLEKPINSDISETSGKIKRFFLFNIFRKRN